MNEPLAIELTFGVVIFGFGALQGFFFSGILFFQQKGNRSANRWLAVILAVVGAFLFTKVAMMSGFYMRIPHIIGAGAPFWYLFGPMIYAYTAFLVSENHRFSATDLLHLLPAVYCLYQMFPFYQLSGADKITAVQTPPTGPPEYHLIYLVVGLLLLGYHFAAIRKINRAEKSITNNSTSHQKENLRWVKRQLIAFTIYIVFDTLAGYLLTVFEIPLNILELTTTFIMAIFVQIVAVTASRNPEKLFPPIVSDPQTNGSHPPIPEPDAQKEKYQNSALSKDIAQNYLDALIHLMETKRPYLNSELKLTDLAAMLGISPHNLSQILNQELKQPFYEFVNQYRINAAKAMMLNPEYQQFTILAIAYDAGFNTKSSFNRAFKECTGMTPSAYQKAHAISSSHIR